jgi:hypothetical protein
VVVGRRVTRIGPPILGQTSARSVQLFAPGAIFLSDQSAA